MNQFEQGLNRYLTSEMLAKITKPKIGIAGAGGLGSNCAQMLVRSGFKNFKIIDFDVIEASNLNRQFYFMHQLGKPKVEVLSDNLMLINPDINVETVQEKFEISIAQTIFADCDAVVEAFDYPEYKKLIVETYIDTDKLLVSASGLAGWGDSDNITVRKIKENFYLIGDLASAVGPECPPLAPRVHIAAAKQADVILSYFLR